MARLPPLLALLTLISSAAAAAASAVRPIGDAHRSAALDVFVPVDGSFGSLEETYEALRTFKILGVENTVDVSQKACPLVVEKLGSSSSTLKELFQALRVNSILGCQVDSGILEDISLRLQAVTKDATSLLDFYYSIGSLLHIKALGSNVVLSDAEGVFHSIKALSQSDGRWHFDSNGAESSTYAAGIALEALAGVVSLAESEVAQSKIGVVKRDILKLFDSIKSYNDGTLYFEEKHVDADEYKSPVATTASVVRGVTAFAEVASGKLNIPSDKMLGLARFFLSVGVSGSPKDFFDQIESLSCLDNNRVAVPLILSLPGTILSLTSKDQLKVEVTTVFGSPAPPLTVTLMQVLGSQSKETSIVESQELKFDPENTIHYLDILPLNMDVGKFTLVFEISLHDPENRNAYATDGQTKVLTFITGSIKIDKAEITVVDNDGGSVEATHKLDLSKDNMVSLTANHLQKLQLSFQLTTPLGHTFKPHQVFLKLRHETKTEHIFLLKSSGRQYKIGLDFLGLVEQFYYLSGRYDIELAVGDATMENSLLRALGHVELDLPEPPEKATRPPPQPVDTYSRFGPKPEISHIFRLPEKKPAEELSYAFSALTLLPLVGFLIGLLRLGVNMKNFPSSSVPAVFSILFHAGIASVLLLYLLFWIKLDLFTTLKALGFLGVFLIVVGHGTLANLAKASAAKIKAN